MNSIDETMLMSLFAHTQQKVIAQDIFERYNLYFSKCNCFGVFWSYRRWCTLCGGYRYKHRISCCECNSEDKY